MYSQRTAFTGSFGIPHAIRNDIRRTLAAKLDDAQLIMAGERIGRAFDTEIDKARRDEARRFGGGESSSGGN